MAEELRSGAETEELGPAPCGLPGTPEAANRQLLLMVIFRTELLFFVPQVHPTFPKPSHHLILSFS